MASQKAGDNDKTLTVTSLKKRRDFLRLRKAPTYRSKLFTVSGRMDAATSGDTRIGYTVTTKLGNAVVRNRIKRRLRAATRSVLPEKGLRGFDYVVIARRAVLRAEYTDLINEFSCALDHIHKNRSKG
ncbi:MAG: ribonuclease P protein component [Rhizobiaceae bacterium]|nr:ribonuclease P protein component [Rhizobiaceae bacterium]